MSNMNLEKLLSNLVFGTSEPPLPFKKFGEKIETYGKIGAGILALFYMAGLIIISFYHSTLHIRSIDLFRVRYLFVGFYFFVFLFLHLFFQYRYLKNWWLKIIYFGLFLLILAFWTDANNYYFSSLFSIWRTGTSYFKFEPVQIQIITGNLITTLGSAVVAPISFTFAIFAYNSKIKQKVIRISALFLLFFAIQISYSIFTNYIFPNIPEALGGGKPPIVRITFSDNVPESVKFNFDISNRVRGYLGSAYYARLVYVDDKSIFLQEAPWYSTWVYELKRDQIEMLRYTEFNPVEMGQPQTP